LPFLYLISCRIFEDELVHIFEKEDENTHLILIENENIQGIEKKLNEVSIEYEKVSIENLSSAIGSDDEYNPNFVVVLNLLELALDAEPQLLKEKVYKHIEQNGELFDGILVFYGLCGNVLGSLERDFAYMGIPVSILRDASGEVVDDCICAAFESRSAYVEAVQGENRGEGTYFLTPMQAANWRELLVLAKLTPDPNDTEMIKFVFEYSGYKNVGKVDTGLSYEKEFDNIVDEFASLFDFEKLLFTGSTKVTEGSYDSMKKRIIQNKQENSS
jgi:hypothetical protein